MTTEKSGHFDDIKQAAIAKAREMGVGNPKELEQIGERAKNSEIEKIGEESEKRYTEYISKYKRIKIRVATALEDVYDKIDFWETYDESLHLPDLPVQIKSGKSDVEKFKGSRKYKKRNGLFLVLNCGPSSTQASFDRDHEAEIEGIKAILEHRVHFI